MDGIYPSEEEHINWKDGGFLQDVRQAEGSSKKGIVKKSEGTGSSKTSGRIVGLKEKHCTRSIEVGWIVTSALNAQSFWERKASVTYSWPSKRTFQYLFWWWIYRRFYGLQFPGGLTWRERLPTVIEGSFEVGLVVNCWNVRKARLAGSGHGSEACQSISLFIPGVLTWLGVQ